LHRPTRCSSGQDAGIQTKTGPAVKAFPLESCNREDPMQQVRNWFGRRVPNQDANELECAIWFALPKAMAPSGTR
jgi:hypothetical protein